MVSGETAIAECITCGKYENVKYLQCGHFVKRNKPNTRFDERNCAAQCKSCNIFKEGDAFNFGRRIDEIYGEGMAKILVDIGAIRGGKLGSYEINLIAEKYKQLTNNLLIQHKIKGWW
jgi:hypothetical protein